MVDFTRRREFKTPEAALLVDGTLPPGVHVFALVVEDASGNRSRVAQVKVEIIRQLIPVMPVTPVVPVRPVIPPIIPRRRPR